MVMDHEAFSMDPKKRNHHQRYIEVELKHKKLLEQKLKELFQGSSSVRPELNAHALIEENRQLKSESIVLKEEKAKDAASH